MANPRIYTRTGDKGQTSLFSGMRVSKASGRVDTYGTIDELDSVLGVVTAHLKASDTSSKYISRILNGIQHDLLEIGALLANPVIAKKHLEEEKKYVAVVVQFEKEIDSMTNKLPILHNFILPGGGQAGSFLHLARTVCRRAERQLVLLHEKEAVEDYVLQYFNRLSDLLFTMARFVNLYEKKKETIWKNR